MWHGWLPVIPNGTSGHGFKPFFYVALIRCRGEIAQSVERPSKVVGATPLTDVGSRHKMVGDTNVDKKNNPCRPICERIADISARNWKKTFNLFDVSS